MTIINAVTGAGADPQLVSIDNAVTEFPQTFSPPEGVDGLSSVTVQAPANFKASNIKKDVEIAGVTGTYETEFNTQSKTAQATAFPTTIEPDSGYDGLASATVTAPDNLTAENIKKGVTIAEIEGVYDPEPDLQRKTKKATAFPVSVEPDENFDGLSKATVTAPDNLEAGNIKKGVTIAGITGTYYPELKSLGIDLGTLDMKPNQYGNSSYVFSPKDFEGYSGVTVYNYPRLDPHKSNLTFANIKKGVNILGYVGTYEGEPVTTQSKSVQATTFPTVVKVDEGYDGMTQVTVTIPDNLEAGNIKKDVEIAGVTGTFGKFQNTSATPTTFPTTYTPTTGYDGIESITVNTPNNLEAGNIKKDVEIAGITGTYEPILETKETQATAFPTVVDVDIGYDGMTEVTVTAPDNLEAGNIKSGVTIAGVTGTFGPTENLTVTPRYFPYTVYKGTDGGIKSVNIRAPNNLEAGNIKKDVTIAGITGTYEPTLETTYAVPTAFPTTYTPTTGFDGIASIEIRTPENLESSNIKKDVTIAGVTGTYEGATGGNAMGLYLTNKPFAITEYAWDGVTGAITKSLASTNVTSVVIGEGITALPNYMFSGCKSLTTVQLPSTLTILPDGCFQNSTISSVNIPYGTSNISISCFYNCANLTEIDIPDTVSILYSYAFNNCTALKTIKVRTQVPPTVQSLALTNLSSLTTIYVPSGKLNVYKAANGWSNYSAKIVEGDF